jgi:cbb3-type cytochrome oxidase maturation protein
MSIVYLLIPLGMVLMGFAVFALFWAVNSGQYDDLEDASRTVLESDDIPGGAVTEIEGHPDQVGE